MNTQSNKYYTVERKLADINTKYSKRKYLILILKFEKI